MSLPPGTRVGPYQVVSPLGKGGMGEVYRARDTELDRDVALKVLPSSVAADPDRLMRFEREAKTLAALNHPHIAHIFGVAQADGVRTLAMELVEGEDLSQRIARGAIPYAEAVAIARQIADALEAAHDSGIVHRDLKPANIKVRDDGVVKVLDFGLAKAIDQGSGIGDRGSGSANSPTITSPAMTMAGVILGTATYMSPEQAKGKPVDRRADIWAFGCVLYEMLAGRRAFDGDDVSETLATIIKGEPDWSKLPAGCPPSVHRLLRRCLQKDPAHRLKHIGDARFDLEDDSRPITAVAGSTRGWARVGWLLGGVAATTAAALFLWPAPPSPDAVVSFAIPLPATLPLRNTTGGLGLALSPDGRTLVYTATNERLVLRRLDSPDLIQLPVLGTNPFFSPDSKWLGYFDAGHLKKVNLAGGPPVTICATVPGRATWGDDGTIVIGTVTSGLWRVADGGGEISLLKELANTENAQPLFLPGAAMILYRDLVDGESWIRTLRLSDGAITDVIQGSNPRLAGRDLLVFERDGALWTAALDSRRGILTGQPVTAIDGAARAAIGITYAASDAGVLAYLPTAPMAETTLVWLDRTGRSEPAVAAMGAYAEPQLSPDGRSVVVSTQAQTPDLLIIDLMRGSTQRLTTEGARRPRWSSTGRIAYQSVGASQDVLVRRADGAGGPEKFVAVPGAQFPDDWSPDGRTLIYNEGSNTRDLWALTEGEQAVRVLPASPFHERGGRVSPSGGWLAFVSNETGRDEVYVQPFPGPGPKAVISTSGGRQPIWSRNGKELYYRADDMLMAVSIRTEPFEAGRPVALFEMSRALFGEDLNRIEYDVAADGRFIAARAKPGNRVDEIRVIVNWVEAFRPRTAAQ